MAYHRDLTGDELHEPKGVATAASGQVYVADGAGSGAWTDRTNGHLIFNTYYLQDQMEDISATSSSFFFIPVKSELINLAVVLHGPTSASDDTLSIYINGVLFADSLVFPTAGSAAGVKASRSISTSNTVASGSVVEVRSNGASSTAAKATIQLGLRAKV